MHRIVNEPKHIFTSDSHHQFVQAECSKTLSGGRAPHHLSSFIIHTAIYHTHTHTPAVHTNEHLQPTNMYRVRLEVWVVTFSVL